MKTEQIAVDELIPYENNPRKHSRAQIEQICDSIEEFGFVAPIIIDEANIVIAGHGRLQAAQKIGLSRIPAVRVAHLSDSQKRALRVADNRLTERAEWDLEGLAEEIKALESEEYDLDILGFDADWLERINLASLGITVDQHGRHRQTEPEERSEQTQKNDDQSSTPLVDMYSTRADEVEPWSSRRLKPGGAFVVAVGALVLSAGPRETDYELTKRAKSASQDQKAELAKKIADFALEEIRSWNL